MPDRRLGWLLLAGDVVCLAGFVLAGLRTHEILGSASAGLRFLINVGPLALAWAAAGLALGAFRFARPAPLRAVLGRSLLAWLLAAPLGLLLRALLLRSATLVVVFVLVTLAVGGSVLLAWRALAWYFVLRRPAL